MEIQEIRNQIFHARSNELLKEFPDECIDLVVTSPPYDDLRDYNGEVAWNFDVFREIAKELYRVMKKGGVVDSQDILGFRYPLATLYPNLDEETIIPVDKSLFTYFRTPEANNIDDNSPLGISVYANAMETLHAIDICFDSFVREFRLGKKRIIVPARMIRNVVDPVTGENVRYFDATDETYEALSTDDPDTLKIQDNSVSLRVEEHVSALNALLNIFCLQVGLSFGTFSFDAKGGLKTATEVVSENSKTYKTVKNFHANPYILASTSNSPFM